MLELPAAPAPPAAAWWYTSAPLLAMQAATLDLPSIATRTARSSVLAGYADLARALGLNPHRMLQRVHLDSRTLVDTELRVPVSVAAQLLELSAIESSTFDFGLRLAERRGVPDLGPLSLLLRQESKFGRALNSLERYFSIHSTGLSLRLQVQDGVPILCTELIDTAFGPTRQAREMILAGLLRFLLWLRGGQWRPQRVCLTHDAPPSLQTHRRVFGCPVDFDQEFDGLVLTHADLEASLAHADPILREQAERHLKSLLAEGDVEFAQTVRKLIAALLPMGDCQAATVARCLGVDRSTLTRRLARSGETYGSILQSVRMTLAAQRVGDGSSSLTCVANALGFSSLSAFSHWFQSTFNCSARHWRRTHGSPSSAPETAPITSNL